MGWGNKVKHEDKLGRTEIKGDKRFIILFLNTMCENVPVFYSFLNTAAVSSLMVQNLINLLICCLQYEVPEGDVGQ